jgi:hypothetical protein
MTTHIVISRSDLFAALNGAYCAGCEGQPYSNPANAAPSGWLPIADAPKDGTWVHGAFPKRGQASEKFPWTIITVRFVDGQWFNQREDESGTPTHFLPLVTPE